MNTNQTGGITGSIISVVVGIYLLVYMLPEPLAQLSDISNKNVTLDSGTTQFGLVASAGTIAMFGVIALIVPIIYLMYFIRKMRF